MKTYKLLRWILMPVLAACTSEVPSDGMELEESGQTFIIRLEDMDGGLTTRAGRPLQSWEPGQDIQHITLYFVNEPTDADKTKGIVLQKEINQTQWKEALDYDYGKQLELSIKEKFPEGKYTVYAVGFSEPSNYTIYPVPESTVIDAIGDYTFIEEAIVPFDFEKEFAAVLKEGKVDAEEIFAGKAEIKATADTGGKTSLSNVGSSASVNPLIILNRQVAGTIGYFTNIPAKVGGISPTKLRLIASNCNNTVNFIDLVEGETIQPDFDISDGDDFGKIADNPDNDNKVTYVVNGSMTGNPVYTQVDFYNTPANKGYVVYEIQLEDFYPYMKQEGKAFADCDLNGDGYVGMSDIKKFIDDFGENSLSAYWNNPRNTQEYPQGLQRGSVYGSSFLIPFKWLELHNTFELQLLGTSDSGADIYLQAWNVKLSKNQLHQIGEIPTVSTGMIIFIEGDKSESCFNVYRNHLYVLGEKPKDAEVTDDKPLDLSKGLELVITIKGLWKGSNNMTI